MRLPVVPMLVLVAAPVAAQDLPDLPHQLSDASSIASAAQTLSGQVGDKLLIRDLLGKELTGSGGEVVGTVENLVAIPGGRLIAALVSTESGQIAVPFAAIKVVGAAESSGLEVPVPASELTGMAELRSLAESLTQ